MTFHGQFSDFPIPRYFGDDSAWPNVDFTVDPELLQIRPHGYEQPYRDFDMISDDIPWAISNEPMEELSSVSWSAIPELSPTATLDSFSGQPCSRHFPSGQRRPVKSERRSPSSVGSIDSDSTFSTEKDLDRHRCSECHEFFGTLQALDRHTQESSHKAWKCQEPGCYREYTRRDTFLRHRTAHGNNAHACVECLSDGKSKVFKRKDHLGEHVRKCHGKGSGSNGFVTPSQATGGNDADRTLGQRRPPHMAAVPIPNANTQDPTQ